MSPLARRVETAAAHAPPVRAWERKRRVAIIAPWALIATTFIVFPVAVDQLGPRWGYLTGFIFFWVGWCVTVPLWLLGARGVARLFRPASPRLPRPAWLWATLLAFPVAGGFATVFVPALEEVTAAALLLALVIAVLNGTLEEVFWRGTFAELFPDEPLTGWLYPAVMFTGWHIAPALATGGRSLWFWFGTFYIGLVFGWVAYRTRTIRWTVPAHVLVNAMGPGFASLLLYGGELTGA